MNHPYYRVTSIAPRLRLMLANILPLPFRRSPLTLAAIGVIVLWLVVGVTAPLIAPYGSLEQDIANRLSPPSQDHWLGTDPLGRDIFSRILYGARISLPVGVVTVFLALLVGTIVGSVAGFFGGIVDELIMRLTDLVLAFPTIILAMVITSALGAGTRNAIIAILVAWWPIYARVVRGLVLSVRNREFVLAVHAAGATRTRVLFRHILPNTISPLIILSTMDLGTVILTFASLSFLGLGPPPESAEWGSIIASGRTYFDQWWIGAFPGFAILSLVFAFNIIGDSLRDLLDPRFRKE